MRIITRYFESADAAKAAMFELVHRRRFSRKIMGLYTSAEGLAETLAEDSVAPATASAYEEKLRKDGGAVLLVRAGSRPLGVAKTFRTVTAEMGGPATDGLTEEVAVKDSPVRSSSSILEDHPRFLTRDADPSQTNYHMADWPLPLISRRKPWTLSALPRHAHMANWPLPLISRRRTKTGRTLLRGKHMANWPIPLLSDRKPYTHSIIPRHARMADWPIPLISRRKPWTGSLIGRHARMANWPFPHLINGKRGTNSLIPGSPHMANWPIPLLSKRKPYTGSVIARHAHMANWPLPLISHRKPYTNSAIPRHGRMADFGMPLIVRNDEMSTKPGKQAFSLSKTMGIPTIIRR